MLPSWEGGGGGGAINAPATQHCTYPQPGECGFSLNRRLPVTDSTHWMTNCSRTFRAGNGKEGLGTRRIMSWKNKQGQLLNTYDVVWTRAYNSKEKRLYFPDGVICVSIWLDLIISWAYRERVLMWIKRFHSTNSLHFGDDKLEEVRMYGHYHINLTHKRVVAAYPEVIKAQTVNFWLQQTLINRLKCLFY